jgi:hypothetical protein
LRIDVRWLGGGQNSSSPSQCIHETRSSPPRPEQKSMCTRRAIHSFMLSACPDWEFARSNHPKSMRKVCGTLTRVCASHPSLENDVAKVAISPRAHPRWHVRACLGYVRCVAHQGLSTELKISLVGQPRRKQRARGCKDSRSLVPNFSPKFTTCGTAGLRILVSGSPPQAENFGGPHLNKRFP